MANTERLTRSLRQLARDPELEFESLGLTINSLREKMMEKFAMVIDEYIEGNHMPALRTLNLQLNDAIELHYGTDSMIEVDSYEKTAATRPKPRRESANPDGWDSIIQ